MLCVNAVWKALEYIVAGTSLTLLIGITMLLRGGIEGQSIADAVSIQRDHPLLRYVTIVDLI